MSPTSPYFNEFSDVPEQRLYADLIQETVYNYGIDCMYMTRQSASNVDLLFGEDPTSVFTVALPMEVYVQSVDSFEGGELFSKFGLEVRKQARFLVTTRTFDRAVATQAANNYYGQANNVAILQRPREGDLVWLQNFDALFEIKFVDEDYFFYTFGKNNVYGYSLVCEKFRYSNEVVATGIDEVDSAMLNITAAYAFIMANTQGSYSYNIGERVTQGNNSATIVSWNLPTLTLVLNNIQGEFQVNSAITGANSGAVFTMVSDNLLENVNPNIDNNTDLANEGVDVLNFSEENPFGEPSP